MRGVVIVCGGRRYKERAVLFAELDAWHTQRSPIRLLVSGGATGADHLAQAWAFERGISYANVPALWKMHGKRAGPIRNRAMLLLDPDAVLAFPGGRGTADMMSAARAQGVPVHELGRPPGSAEADAGAMVRRCQRCGYAIAEVEWQAMAFTLPCPRCKGRSFEREVLS